MYVKTHWGKRQLEGGLAEIGTAKTSLLFAAGVGWRCSGDAEREDSFQLEGLTYGTPAFDWVFLAGQENDPDLVEKILPGIDVFAGDRAMSVWEESARCMERRGPEIYLGFQTRQTIQLDDIRVTPLSLDSSAGDADSFLLQAEGKAVVYTVVRQPAGGVLETVRKQLGIREPLDLLIWEDMGTHLECGLGRWMLRDGERWEIR